MADCDGCTGSCTGCSGSCSGTCSGSCSGSCSGTCRGSCRGSCSGGCSGGCKGSCSGCTGSCTGTCNSGCTNTCVTACTFSCKDECKGNFYKTCNTTCYDTCKSKCKGTCATVCQNYCETEQTFSKNSIGKPQFTKWGESNGIKRNETIKITAEDWNTLKSYIKSATDYCGGTKPSLSDVDKGDLITEDQFNDLANGLNLTNVVKDVTIISADIINSLQSTYNSRQIIPNKPTSTTDGKPLTGTEHECCQKGQTCMSTSTQLLSHQGKTESCQDQTKSSCGNQTPGGDGPQVGK